MKLVAKKTKVNKKSENTNAPTYTDLRQIMDYTRDFSIIYSGVENDTYFKGCYNMGVRNFLMSYHYLQKMKAPLSSKYEGTGVKFFIDSGAHTYQQDPKYREYTAEHWEKHIQSYLKWVERNKDYIFAIANSDFENLVGPELVYEWNTKYFEPFMLRTGIPVCFVWHQNSYKDWEHYCQRYPYVGFSSVNIESGEGITLNEYKEQLKIAEKHNALVHGFGMTRTSLLPQLPFYTVDSTSWKSGFMYGQLAIWNGKKVQMFKKEDWETKAFKYLDNYEGISLDKNLLYEYYEPEVLRANVFAYQRAEEFIIDRLKPLTYWKKPKINKKDINNLPKDFYPTLDWLISDSEDGLKDYCIKMNVNPEIEGVKTLITDITAFMNWDNPEYLDLINWYNEPEQEVLINELHNNYVNRIVSNKDDKIKDLQNFFKSCIIGENDKLLHLGTNFDRTVKERENYIEEDDSELIDVSIEEVKSRLHNLLPDKSFEEDDGSDIMALDEEIYRKIDIVPTFDERGKFVKGQVAVRKPKRVYSKKFPKMACDTCFAAAKCSEYKAGYVCAYNKMFDRFDTRNMGDIIQSIQGIVDFNMQRMQRSMILETLSGTIDPVTTQLMDTNIRYMQMLKQLYENGSSEVLRQTKVLKSDGTEETTTSITNPQSGGIMEKLLGSLMNNSNNTDNKGDVIDVEPKEVTKKED